MVPVDGSETRLGALLDPRSDAVAAVYMPTAEHVRLLDDSVGILRAVGLMTDRTADFFLLNADIIVVVVARRRH